MKLTINAKESKMIIECIEEEYLDIGTPKEHVNMVACNFMQNNQVASRIMLRIIKKMSVNTY